MANPLALSPFAPNSLFDKATQFETLHAAWLKCKDNQGAAGGDGITIAQFDKQAANNLSRLSHNLRNNRYVPEDMRHCQIPKKSGGFRPLTIPSIADRVVQGAVAITLTPLLEQEFEESSFAYRPGRSVAKAVQRIASLRRDGFKHVVEADIVKFFENIRHDKLIAKLCSLIQDAALIDLIAIWLEQFSHTERGIAQGSPLSPLLANLYLDKLDEEMQDQGLRIVRFADDFVLLAKEETTAQEALNDAIAHLKQEGLELNADKTRIVSFEKGFRFLGHLFVRSMILKEVEFDETPHETAIVEEQPFDEKPARGELSPRQRVLYMLEPNRLLSAHGEHFIVKEDDTVIFDEPHTRLDRIEVGEQCKLDEKALDLASHTDTAIARVDGYGRIMGLWLAPSHSASRELAQAGAVLDPAKRLIMARAFVGGRIHNQRIFLKRLEKKSDMQELPVVTASLKRLHRKVMLEPNLDISTLMGFEGQATALYYPLLAKYLNDDALFKGTRKRRIGYDPMNSVMDIIAGFLVRDMLVALQRHGLHSGFAFLHEGRNGREALCFDLMEEFRAPLLEAVALSLFTKKALTLASFVKKGEYYKISSQGYAACIRGYEAAVSRPVTGDKGRKMLYRGIFEQQAVKIAKFCETGESYTPFEISY